MSGEVIRLVPGSVFAGDYKVIRPLRTGGQGSLFTVVVAILAEGETLGSSGRELVTAYVAGYEVWADLLRRDANHHRKGWHPTAIFGVMGAAAAAWSVFRRMLRQPEAWFATALFALHPLQTEAVSYVFARATVLATLLCLLAWRDWLADRRWRAVAWFCV